MRTVAISSPGKGANLNIRPPQPETIMMRSRRSTMKVLSGGVRIVSHRCSDDAVPFDIPQVGTKSLKHGPSLLWRYRPERIASSRFARSCSFRSNADTRLQRDPSGSLHNTDTGRDRGSDEMASSVRSLAQRSSTTMSLPSCPGAGYELIEGHGYASTAALSSSSISLPSAPDNQIHASAY